MSGQNTSHGVGTNEVYCQVKDNLRLRTLSVYPDEDLAITIVLNGHAALPKQARLKDLNEALLCHQLLPVDYHESASDPCAGAAAKSVFEKKYRPAVLELLDMGYRRLSEGLVWPEIRRVADKYEINPSTLSKKLGLVIKSGGVIEAALPNWGKCGRKSAHGRPTQSTSQPGSYPLSAVDFGKIQDGMQKYYRDNATWKQAYEAFLQQYYPAKIIANAGLDVVVPLPPGERPSLKQFKHHGKQIVGIETRLRRNKGDRLYETQHRAKPHGQTYNGIYPGHVAEIDWSLTDIVGVARGTRLSIGRFVIYVVVDVYSGLVLAVYLTVGTANYYEASRAILQCLENKGELLKRYDSCFGEEHWPVSCLPPEIRADKGEIDSWKAKGLINFSGVNVEYCASKRPDQKGTCESFFNVTRWQLRRLRGGTSGMKERLKDHPNVTAVYDFKQVYKLLLNLVVKFNARIRRRQALTPGMVADGVLPVPNKMWAWAQERGCVRSYPLDKARIEILPSFSASVTAEGIRIKGLHYMVPNSHGIDPNDWMITARIKVFRANFATDPATVNFVYLLHVDSNSETVPIVCNLAPEDNGWLDYTWAEYEAEKKDRTSDICDYRESELRLISVTADADNDKLTKEAKSATRSARMGLSTVEQIRGTEQRRALENVEITSSPPLKNVPASTPFSGEDDFVDKDWKAARKAS